MSVTALVFPELQPHALQHVFTLRSPGLSLKADCAEILQKLSFPHERLVLAEQVHGNHVAVVDASNNGQTIPGADALITKEPELTLAVRTADCGPLFLYDPVQHAAGVVHSGKKGTEAKILTAAIQAMELEFQSKASDMVVVLGPCIRPPHYEIDFATSIREQALGSGVQAYHDCCIDTASDLKRYYSYRMEKGQTGRHYAAIQLLSIS